MAENLDEKPIGEEFLRMFKEAKRDDDLAQKGLHMELSAARRRIQEQDALLNAIRNEVPNSPPSQNLILAVKSAICDRDLRIWRLEDELTRLRRVGRDILDLFRSGENPADYDDDLEKAVELFGGRE